MHKGLELSVQSSLKGNTGISKTFLQHIVDSIAKDQKVKGVMSISFIGADKMRTLNRVYRNKDKVTDILSFPAQEGEGFLTGEENDLGDIFLCYPRLVSQAKKYGHSLKEEVTVLVVHGALHLLGYDHERDMDYTKMKKVEERILKKLA